MDFLTTGSFTGRLVPFFFMQLDYILGCKILNDYSVRRYCKTLSITHSKVR